MFTFVFEKKILLIRSKVFFEIFFSFSEQYLNFIFILQSFEGVQFKNFLDNLRIYSKVVLIIFVSKKIIIIFVVLSNQNEKKEKKKSYICMCINCFKFNYWIQWFVIFILQNLWYIIIIGFHFMSLAVSLLS